MELEPVKTDWLFDHDNVFRSGSKTDFIEELAQSNDVDDSHRGEMNVCNLVKDQICRANICASGQKDSEFIEETKKHTESTTTEDAAAFTGSSGTSEECAPDVDSLLQIFPFICGFCHLPYNRVNCYFEHLMSHTECKDDSFHICLDGETKKGEATDDGYICGLCYSVFPTVCLLHEHMLCKENVDKYTFDKSTKSTQPCSLDSVDDHEKRYSSKASQKRDASKSSREKKKSDESLTNILSVTLYKDGTIKEIDFNPASKSSLKKANKQAGDVSRKENLPASANAEAGRSFFEETSNEFDDIGDETEEVSDDKAEIGVDKEVGSISFVEMPNVVDEDDDELTEDNDEGFETGVAIDEVRNADTLTGNDQSSFANDNNTGNITKCSLDQQLDNVIENKQPMQLQEKTWKQTLVSCQKCGQKVKKSNLKRHEDIYCRKQQIILKCQERKKLKKSKKPETIPSQQTLVSCQKCGQRVWKSSLKRHEANYCLKKKPQKCQKRTQGSCQKCEQMGLKLNLKQHEELHGHRRRVKCPECDMIFRTHWSLKAHMVKHTGEAKYICDKCGKAFKYYGSLYEHRLIHNEGRNVQCSVCPKRFKHRYALGAHMLTHADKKPWVCEVCGKSFHRSSDLTTHKIVHSEVRDFFCSRCNKHFKTKEVLRVHEKIHQPFGYFCPVCSKGFVQKSNMHIHMKTHIKEKKQSENTLTEEV